MCDQSGGSRNGVCHDRNPLMKIVLYVFPEETSGIFSQVTVTRQDTKGTVVFTAIFDPTNQQGVKYILYLLS